jgi:hypothetical protein
MWPLGITLGNRLTRLTNSWREYLGVRVERLKWQLAGRPVPPPHSFKVQVVQQYARRFKTPVLVETGTYRAQMIKGVHSSFHLIHSIELGVELHALASVATAALANVILWQGDSSTVLPQILSTLGGPCLFWLDAHYSGGETARGSSDTPILQELRVIFCYPRILPIVLIDDAREFGVAVDYPSIARMRELVGSIRRGWSFTVADDIIRIHPSTRWQIRH